MSYNINQTISKYPLVSVIIPTYNCAKYIETTINSVLNQNYDNLEIIVVDDGSTDNTKNIISSITDDRLIYYFIKNSGGPAKPRNLGLMNCKGDYIAFLDSDDKWRNDKVMKQIFSFLKGKLGGSDPIQDL
jgi:glycosyltransferase involved in cell wall biosynthesis